MANDPYRLIVGLSEGEQGIPVVILGLPEEGWKYCQNGKTHTVDLTQIGLPVRIILFGGKDHAEINSWLEAHTAGVDGMSENLPILGEDNDRKPS